MPKPLLLVILCGYISTAAQQPAYIYRHLTEQDGLASNNVMGIQQDKAGFMWFATDNGLQRYDGARFRIWHHDPTDTASIPSDLCGSLLRDKENNIWMFTPFFGWNKFNPATGRNIRVNNFSDSTQKKLDDANEACMDADGDIWFTGVHTFGKYDSRQHRLISWEKVVPPGPEIGMSMATVDPATNQIWLNSYSLGVCMLDADRKTFYYRGNNPQRLPVFSIAEPPGKLFLDRGHVLWINTYKGRLYRYDLRSRRLKRCFRTDSTPVFVSGYLQDQRGIVWIATDNGLLQYDAATDRFNAIPRKQGDMEGVDYNTDIHSLFQDKDGTIWVATDKGVNILEGFGGKFTCIPNPPDPSFPPEKKSILSFTETADGHLWAATTPGGIQVFNRDLSPSKRFEFNARDVHALKEPGNRIWSLLSRPDGSVWVGCQHGWLSIYDPVSGGFSSSQPPELDKRTIIKMTTDRRQRVWFALHSGVASWDSLSGRFMHYTRLLPYHNIYVSQVNDILFDDDDRCWVASLTNGLQLFDPETEKFTRMYVPVSGDPHSISSHIILSLARINDSLLAVGTMAGINLFNKRTGRFDYITAANGLPDNSVVAMRFSPPSNLWAVTNKGICKVNIQTGHVSSYGPQDGITSTEFWNCTQFFRLKDGRFAAGYQGGFVCFHPDSIQDRKPPPDVMIAECEVNGRPLDLDSIRRVAAGVVSLPHDQNLLTIHFSCLSFKASGRIDYYYLLQNLEKDWVRADQRQTATYTYLPPGKYTFLAKCENEDGVSCAEVTQFSLIIRPPFWQTWWFRTAVIFSILLLGYALYRYRINSIIKLQSVRNGISRDLHDDIGATLSSIRVLSEVAKSNLEKGWQDKSFPLLSKISDQSRDMVERMSDIVWTISPRKENLENLRQRLNDFAALACLSRGIQLQFKADKELDRLSLPMLFRKNMYLIGKEAINNALKHSGCTRIAVTVQNRQDNLILIVADDGSGFDASMVKRANGIDNMEARAKEIKGRLIFHSAGEGTELRLEVAIPRSRHSGFQYFV